MALQAVKSPATEEQPLRMTYEEYREWAKDHPHSEWADGEAFAFMSVTARHSLIVVFLVKLLGAYVDVRGLGIVLGDPFAMLVRGGRASRQPDLALVLPHNQHRLALNRDYLDGPADLVIEVVSEGSVRLDRKTKVTDYARAGVPEYWIIEGREGWHGVELLVRNEAGVYEPHLPDDEGRLRSTVLPGFWIDPAWFTENPLPNVDDILDEIAPGILDERAEQVRQRRAARQANAES
jgi:Uma2 family endonuclease